MTQPNEQSDHHDQDHEHGHDHGSSPVRVIVWYDYI